MTYWALMLCWSRYNKSSLDFSLRVVGKYFGQYCSLVYLVDIMYYFLRGASAACIFFSGGPKPPLIKFGIFHQEKTCPPEENKAPPLRKKSAPLKIQSARKFTASPPKRYLGRRVCGEWVANSPGWFLDIFCTFYIFAVQWRSTLKRGEGNPNIRGRAKKAYNARDNCQFTI